MKNEPILTLTAIAYHTKAQQEPAVLLTYMYTQNIRKCNSLGFYREKGEGDHLVLLRSILSP